MLSPPSQVASPGQWQGRQRPDCPAASLPVRLCSKKGPGRPILELQNSLGLLEPRFEDTEAGAMPS